MKLPVRILVAAGFLAVAAPVQAADVMPLVDAHLHYSHDAWENLPPKDAIAAIRRAGLKKAFVSSSSDDGTQMLYAAAPDLIVPVLRPYRKRGELGTWFRDPTVIDMLESRLKKGGYAGIGEFHIFGADADGAVFRKVVQLAKKYKVFLHAHSDADAVDRIFKQDPDATVLWAHSGFAEPDRIAPMLKFMIGTDTYTPERWYFVEEHAGWSRTWLQSLPRGLAERIAWKNAMELANWALKIKD